MKIEDLKNILLKENPSIYLKQNEEELFNLIPELKRCKGFDQNNDWHIYDVYEHILHVVDNVSPNIIIRLAALFHDVGKPFKYVEDENGIGHFYGHWEVSKEVFDRFSSKYDLNTNIELISNLIFYHDKSISKMSDDEKEELKNIFGNDGLELLFELKKADHLAQNPKYNYYLDIIEEERKMLLNEK